MEQVTAMATNHGDYAIFEYTAALPRAKLYSNWLVSTNTSEILQALASQYFDPEKTVLLTGPVPNVPDRSTGNNSGTVDFKSYSPKDIVLAAQADKPSVLLLNDKSDPDWHVYVDGQSAPILRCNFIMRGVYLMPGSHAVEFRYEEPHGPLNVTLATMFAGFFMCGYLFYSTHRAKAAAKN
jgi:hypothetical protein